MNKQEKFWHSEYADKYIERNSAFDSAQGVVAWEKMLSGTTQIESILELGCNIGRNLDSLVKLYPAASLSVVEISPKAFEIVTSKFRFEFAENCSIADAHLPLDKFDLVFTSGVLIHIAPEDLFEVMKKMYDLSSKYILICEMFSRVPRTVHYNGSDDLLFTRDFGRYFLENFSCEVVDYGFLWGHYFDSAGFDDANYWLFEKK